MKAHRVQIRVALLIVVLLALIFWTVRQITEAQLSPTKLLWVEHVDAEQINTLEKAPDNAVDRASQQAFKCKPNSFSISLSVNGLHSVYWKADEVDDALIDCLTGSGGEDLMVSWDGAAQRPFTPPHILKGRVEF